MVGDDGDKGKHFQTRDPLGEIRRRARELWEEAGKPANKGWPAFFDEAEEQLVGGVSSGRPSGRHRNPMRDHEVAPQVASAASQSEDGLLSIVASALKQLLTHQEALCLAYVLESHCIVLKDGKRLQPSDDHETATVLAALASEYDEGFLRQQHAHSPFEIDPQARIDYWERVLLGRHREDNALTNLDRNTVNRLVTALRAEPRIDRVDYLP